MSNDAEQHRASGITLAGEQQHILRCLGAAIIIQCNTIPTKLQRELFDTAGSLGNVLQTVTLRGQIAHFLHNHKHEERPPSRYLPMLRPSPTRARKDFVSNGRSAGRLSSAM